MNREPDAGVVDFDTEEWPTPEADSFEPAAVEDYGPAPLDADEQGWEPDSADPDGMIAAERVQPRHARPRDVHKLQTAVLAVALVIAVGFALYFWLQVDSASDGNATSGGDLAVRLEQANARLADTAGELREAQVRGGAAEAEARELQQQLDETSAASAEADRELAEVAEELQAVSDSLAAARSQGDALASAVLGSVDPVDACVRAAARVAENADQIGRGRLAEEAREAAAACAAAQETLALAVSQARDVLSD